MMTMTGAEMVSTADKPEAVQPDLGSIPSASTTTCPVCHGSGCACCGSTGAIPFPWTDPSDRKLYQPWTADEVAVITGAPSAVDAFRRYSSVYGEYERTLSSVSGRWRMNCGTVNCWTAPELDAIDDAVDVATAVQRYQYEYGTARTERAIRARWYRLKARGV